MSTSWRDILPVHPAADLFPTMTPDEITALGEDIKNNGLKQPIVLIKTPDGDALLDGRNRLDAMASVGLITDLNLIEHRVLDADADPFAFVISANIYRRHLTADQRRDLIAKVLKATPDASNRQIAAQVKADDKTVAKVRKVLEATADIPRLAKTTGKDGKARTTTPQKPAPPPPTAPAPEPASAPEDDFPEMPAFLARGKLAEPQPDEPGTKIDLDRLRNEAEELQKIVRDATSSEYNDAYSSAAEYVVTSLKGYDADVFLPLILAALGEPAILGQT
jgi:ParB-like chromosome segregation protein Spo0J